MEEGYYVAVGADISGLNKGFDAAEARVQTFSKDLRTQVSLAESEASEFAFACGIMTDAEYEQYVAGQKVTAQLAAESAARRKNMSVLEQEAEARVLAAAFERAAIKQGAASTAEYMGTVALQAEAVAVKGARAGVGLNTVRAGLTGLLASALQTAPGVAQVASATGTLAIGTPMMVGVLAGIAALAFAWHELTEKERENKKVTDEAIDTMDQLLAKKRKGLVGDLNRGIVEADDKIKDLQARIAEEEASNKRFGIRPVDDKWLPKAKQQLDEWVIKRQTAADEVKKITQDAIDDEVAKFNAAQKDKERIARDAKITPFGISVASKDDVAWMIGEQKKLTDSIADMTRQRSIATTAGEYDDLGKKIAAAKVQSDALAASIARYGPGINAIGVRPITAGPMSGGSVNIVRPLPNVSEITEQPEVPRPAMQAAQDRINAARDAGFVPPELKAQLLEDAKMLREHADAVARVNKELDGGGGFHGALKSLGSMVRGAGSQLLQVFNPIGIIGQVFSGALQEVGKNLMPIISILGQALTPVLKALFPVFKAIVIAATYVGEIFFKVSGGIAKAIGSLIAGLGKLLNKLPGSIGNPLIKAGNALKDFGQGELDAAQAMHEARDQIKGLKWQDADDQIQKVTESLSNVPLAFNAALARYRIGMGGSAMPGFQGASPVSTTSLAFTGDIHVYAAPGEDPGAFWDRVMNAATRSAAVGDPRAIAMLSKIGWAR